ncbi:hypothetical protein ES332_D03G087300v1 [Gossypium tomentosum]|uniref:Uncharacterized protein n=1 Tax=Gossypium tomentosum TaxID=34277 RepID=A0A5D2LJX8_GOSTO|nr:hypothetical protein ES332_D03G087300v1 [Gossypium tomentosum]
MDNHRNLTNQLLFLFNFYFTCSIVQKHGYNLLHCGQFENFCLNTFARLIMDTYYLIIGIIHV